MEPTAKIYYSGKRGGYNYVARNTEVVYFDSPRCYGAASELEKCIASATAEYGDGNVWVSPHAHRRALQTGN